MQNDDFDPPTAVYEPYDEVEIVEVEECQVGFVEGPTQVFSFDGALDTEAKVVIGYLTLEQQGWFADMSQTEQRRVLDTLRGSN
jgi:hypothetical protein